MVSASGGTPSQIVGNNLRVANSLNGKLYFSTGSSTPGIGIWAFSGMPTASETPTSYISLNGADTSPYGFAIKSDSTIAYVADDSTSGSGIYKYTSSNGGSTWTYAYTLISGTGARQLAVDFSGANPVIYATTAETSLNRLIEITDTGSGSTATTLATATANYIFRGVAFAPCTSPVAPATTGASRCGSGSVSLSASGSGGTLTWYSDAGLTTVVASGTSSYNTPSLSSTTTYYVTETSAGGCVSSASPVTATVNTPPTAPDSNAGNVTNQTVVLSVEKLLRRATGTGLSVTAVRTPAP